MAIGIASWEFFAVEEVMSMVALLPSSKVENEISDALRHAPPADASATIFSILSADDPSVRLAGLRIAKRVIRDGVEAAKIVSMGLERGDAYEIRFWLQSASAIIGVRKTLNAIAESASVIPSKVVKSWREISAFADSDQRSRNTIDRIVTIIDELINDLDGATREYWIEVKSDGIHSKG